MLQHLPRTVGYVLRKARPGRARLTLNTREFHDVPAELTVTSNALTEGGRIPERFTADGEGVSPDLGWTEVPIGTTWIAILVEDADSPTPSPLVHAIAFGPSRPEGAIDEGALSGRAALPPGFQIGRNSYLGMSWLPPDPPPGHGPHRYAFQMFAIRGAPLQPAAGRNALIKQMRGSVMAAGCLTCSYERI